MNPPKHPSSWNPPKHSHCPFFFWRNYEPARQLFLFYFQVVIIIPTNHQMTASFFFQVVIMNPQKHPSSWNPPKHSHWRSDDWTFFFWTYYEPVRQLYLFFQVVIIIPTNGQMTVPFFFQVVIMNPPKHPSSWNPPKHSHWWPDNWTFFFRT
jgi:hypothetical protein